MTRFRVIRGGLDEPPGDAPDPALNRRLRSLYAPPGDGYWDGLEASVMAAVRAGRAAPSVAAEWWQTLANWARPGLAAAAVVIGVVGGVTVQSHGVRAKSTFGALIEEPASPLVPLSGEYARDIDGWATDSASVRARTAADLLSDGVKRRPLVPLDLDAPAVPAADASSPDSVEARREATFRYLIP